MLSLLFTVLALQGAKDGQAVLDQWQAKLKPVQSVTMKLVTEVMTQKQVIDVKILRGGYVRAIMGAPMNMEQIMTPKGGWSLRPETKEYTKSGATAMKPTDALPGWEALFPAAVPLTALGGPEKSKFGDKDALRIGVKGNSDFAGPGKTYLYFDPSTQSAVGFESAISNMSMKMGFQDVKLEAGLTPADFEWTPPAGWKEASAPEVSRSSAEPALLKLGSKAPAFSLKTPSGTKTSLAKVMAGRKVTLVNFWFYG